MVDETQSTRDRILEACERGQAAIKHALHEMAGRGLLKATSEDIDRLVVNAWIICSYWLDYLDSRHNIDKVTRAHLDWGAGGE